MSGSIWEQVQQPVTYGSLALVFVIGGAFIAFMSRMAARARAELAAVTEDLYGSHPTQMLDQELSRQVARRLPDGRYVVREAPLVTIEAWFERNVVHSWSFEAGAWITGCALAITFFLIALVLANQVGPAINAMTDVDVAQISGAGAKPSSEMRALSGAVSSMGAKFLVSMLGIALAIVHAARRNRLIHELHNRVTEAAARLVGVSVLPADLQVELSRETVNSIRELRQSLVPEVQKLQSIEVSLKDIGTELASQLQHTVKRDIVEGIRRDLEEVVDKLQHALAESFAETLRQHMLEVTTELRAIQTAVSGQARDQVGELLTKLSNVVSGGFAAESSRMKDSLEQFATVVPELAAQMRTMMQSASADVASRGAETARASQALVEQLERVLGAIEGQQRTAIASTSTMTALVAQSEQTLASSLAKANDQILARSQVTLDALTSAVTGSTAEATQVYRSLVKEVEAAGQLVASVRNDALDGAQNLKEGARAVREVLREVKDGLAVFRSASEPLVRTVADARGVASEGSAALQASIHAVKQHQAFVDALAKQWPLLTTQHREAFERASTSIAEAWDVQSRTIEGAVSRIGNGFNSSATEFASAVEELREQIEALQKALNAPLSSRPRVQG